LRSTLAFRARARRRTRDAHHIFHGDKSALALSSHAKIQKHLEKISRRDIERTKRNRSQIKPTRKKFRRSHALVYTKNRVKSRSPKPRK
jgi:hypothetical protein